MIKELNLDKKIKGHWLKKYYLESLPRIRSND